MGDALTDIGRDEERTIRIEDYLKGLCNYLEEPTPENYQGLEETARNSDSIRSGFWGSRTNLLKRLPLLTEELKEGNEQTWLRTITSFRGFNGYERLKSLSPFKNNVFLNVSYGSGFISTTALEGLEGMASEHLREQDYKTYDCDDYALVLPISKEELNKLIEKSGIYWISSGILEQKTPRRKDGSPRDS